MNKKIESFPIRRIGRGLKLRDEVQRMSVRKYKPVCLSDLAVLLSCFKASNFGHEACSEEIKNFQSCYDRMQKSSQVKSGEQDLKDMKLKRLFKQYPIV